MSQPRKPLWAGNNLNPRAEMRLAVDSFSFLFCFVLHPIVASFTIHEAFSRGPEAPTPGLNKRS